MSTTRILVGDALARLRDLPDESVQCVVTSPPYFGLRAYLDDDHPDKAHEHGLEPTPGEYVARMVEAFREVRRVLRSDGVCWLNLGDSYAATHTGALGRGERAEGFNFAESRLDGQGKGRRREQSIPEGLKPKDLIGIPWRVAFALQADGWWLRSDIVWAKSSCMPESVKDRPSRAHEYVFLLTKSERYFYDAEAGRSASGNGNARTVWTFPTHPFRGAHFATMPPALAEQSIRAGSAEGDTILDPFGGAGTTPLVANRLGRDAIMCELSPEYAEMARRRVYGDAPMFRKVVIE